jgi:hypothetical protein
MKNDLLAILDFNEIDYGIKMSSIFENIFVVPKENILISTYCL